jgi:predicted nucleic acid-binding protein
MSEKGIMLDTSFFVRLLDKTDPLHANALGYFKYALENDFEIYISTIAVAEYCVKGKLEELPLRNLRILPFNLKHGTRAGQIAKLVFEHRNKLQLSQRTIIPNDSKLFAQSDCEPEILYYLSSDSESKKVHNLVNKEGLNLNFQFLDLKTPFGEAFGVLGF